MFNDLFGEATGQEEGLTGVNEDEESEVEPDGGQVKPKAVSQETYDNLFETSISGDEEFTGFNYSILTTDTERDDEDFRKHNSYQEKE